jgi:hypothetical protein
VSATTAAVPSWAISSAETSTTAATFATRPLLRYINNDRTTLNICAVKHLLPLLGLSVARHLDESKATLTSCCRVENYSRRYNRAGLTKQLGEVTILEREG